MGEGKHGRGREEAERAVHSMRSARLLLCGTQHAQLGSTARSAVCGHLQVQTN